MRKPEPPIAGVESGLEKVESKSEPDAEDRLEDAAVEKSAAETKVLLEGARNSKDIRFLRRFYSKKFYRLAIVYLIYLAFLTFIQGFHIWGFSLDGMVLVAIIGVPMVGIVWKIISGSSV